MVKIPGKVFPVTTKYLPTSLRGGRGGRNLWTRAKKPEEYIDMAVEKVVRIHQENHSRTGDILLFLPGKEEV